MLVTRRSAATGEIRVLSLPITAEEAAAFAAEGLIEDAFDCSERTAPVPDQTTAPLSLKHAA